MAFDWAVSHISENYSGYETKTAGGRKADLEALTRRLRSEVVAGEPNALQAALENYVGWFDDGHLQVSWIHEDAVRERWEPPETTMTEASVLAQVAALGPERAAVEGLWQIDDVYGLAVLRRNGAAGVYDAVILETTSDGWREGEVKAVLTDRRDGTYDVQYGTADRHLVRFTAKLGARAEILYTDDYGSWLRSSDDPAEARALLRRNAPSVFSVERLDAQTLYIRAPSFDLSHVATLDALVAQYQDEIARTPQLIIDVRQNGGGGDRTWNALIPPLYTQPIYRIGVEVRASPANTKALRELVLPIVQSNAPDLAPVLNAQILRMENANAPFVPGEPYPFSIIRHEMVWENPVRVGVLIDDAASAAENFILAARQSRKVTLMGQSNSAGVVDFGDVIPITAPSGQFTLFAPTTRSLRLPLDPVDPHGISPDVLIPGDVNDPVSWAADWLAAGARTIDTETN